MALTTDQQERAAKIVASWFWQMGEGHNFRWKNAVKSVTLFYESAPMSADIAQLVIEYLRTREAVTEFMVNNKTWTFAAPGWNAKDAWYQTASGEKWAGTESTKVRVYWVLVQAGDGTADGPYVVENGCKYSVSHSYYWNVTEQPSLPASTSGVQWSIQGFTRDKETGLFTYILEKRETVQQDIALYLSQTTIFEDVSKEQHLGVKQEDVPTTGLDASVDDGTLVERELSKNPDCTTDIQNRKIVEKSVTGAVVEYRKNTRSLVTTTADRNQDNPVNATNLAVGETRRSEKTPGNKNNNTVVTTTPVAAGTVVEECTQNLFEHRDSTTENQLQHPQASEVPAPNNNGVVKRQIVRKTEENSFDVQTETTTELKVESARVVESRGLRGVRTSTTDRNLNATELQAKTAADVAPGETRTVEKTPGDLNNLTVDNFTPNSPAKISESCQALTTVHTDTSVTSVPANAIGFAEQVAEVNKLKLLTYRLNEDGATADKTVTTQTWFERSAPSASDSGGTVQTTVTRKINSPTAPAAVAAGPNVVREVDAQPNEHGSFTTSERTTVYNEQTAVSTSNFATETAVTTTKTHTLSPATAAQGNASANPNDHGTATTQVTEFTPHFIDSGWIVWQRKQNTTRGTYTYQCGVRVFVNAPSPAFAIIGATGKDVQLSPRINRYGLYDGQAHYSELISFEEYGEGSGMFGGIQDGRITFKGTTYNTKVFYGRGNEGSEAYYKANCIIVPGLKLPERMYFTGIVSGGNS